MKSLPPLKQKILSDTEQQKLKKIYLQLYPHKQFSHWSALYQSCARVLLGRKVINSTSYGRGSSASCVIMAYWPRIGSDLSSIDYAAKMSVGVVQYFIIHAVYVDDVDATTAHVQSAWDHVFAYVLWKQRHPHEDWFGASATVSSDLFETTGACCFLPVQRIAYMCAYAKFPIQFGPHFDEQVFVSCPTPLV